MHSQALRLEYLCFLTTSMLSLRIDCIAHCVIKSSFYCSSAHAQQLLFWRRYTVDGPRIPCLLIEPHAWKSWEEPLLWKGKAFRCLFKRYLRCSRFLLLFQSSLRLQCFFDVLRRSRDQHIMSFINKHVQQHPNLCWREILLLVLLWIYFKS